MHVTRVAAATAATVIVAASIVVGATPAWAVPPPAPTIDQLHPDPWTTSLARPYDLQGDKALDVERIDIYIAGTQLFCTAAATPGSTIWFCPSPVSDLAIGVNQLQAVAVNGLGESSPLGPPLEITRVVAPEITSFADGAITNDSTPTISGTAVGDSADLRDSTGVICTGVVTGGAWACTPGPLVDGSYSLFVDVYPGNDNRSEIRTLTVDTVPPPLTTITAPSGPMSGGTMTATTNVAQPTIVGTGEPGASVEVYQDYSLVTCSVPAVVASDGSWSCTLSSSLAPGSYIFGSIQTDAAGNPGTPGSPDPQLQLTVTAPPPPPVIPPGAPAPAPVIVAVTPPVVAPPVVVPPVIGWVLSFLADSDSVTAGQKVTLTSSGLPPGAAVSVELHSTPIPLGTTVVDPDGSFRFTSVIPQTVEPGDHHYVVTVTPPGEQPVTAQRPVKVLEVEPVADPAAEVEQPETTSIATTRNATEDSGVDRNDPAAPTALSEAIPTAHDVVSNPMLVAAAGVVALVLLLLVAIPSELLNSTLASNTGRLGAFFARAERASNRAVRRVTEWFRTPAVPAALLIIVASIIFGFVDPAFGFDLASLRLVLGLAIALFVLTYVASRLSGTIIRRAWSVESSISMQPIALVFAALGVVAARLLEFSPGFFVGLVIGLDLATRTPEARRARSSLVQLGLIVGISLAAWLGYSLLRTVEAEPTFGGLLLQETLVALTAEGLTGALVAILPIAMLDGKQIFDRSKPLWAAAFLIIATVFALLVLPTGIGFLEVQDLVVWIIVLACFSVLTLSLWAALYFTQKKRPDIEDGPKPVGADDLLLRQQTRSR